MTPTEPLRSVEQIARDTCRRFGHDSSPCDNCERVTAALRRERDEAKAASEALCFAQAAILEAARAELMLARDTQDGAYVRDLRAEIDRLRALVGEALELVGFNPEQVDMSLVIADLRRRAGLEGVGRPDGMPGSPGGGPGSADRDQG